MSRVKIHIQDLIDDPTGVLRAGESSFSDGTWKKLTLKYSTEKRLIEKFNIDDKRDKK
jgi:hypothetical protein